MKRILLTLSVLLILGIVAGCAPTVPPEVQEIPAAAEKEVSTGPATKEGGTLVIADPMGGYTLDPFKSPWHSTGHYLIYATLLDKDPDLNYVPYLAESWEASEDGLEITVKLREDVTFHDGTPLNAEAVKFNFDRWIDPEVAAPGGFVLGPLESTEVIDEYTVKLHYQEPFALVWDGLSFAEIASPTAIKKWGDDFAQHPVGAGPYIIKEILPDDHITYVRNPDFKWGPPYYQNQGPAYPDEIILKIIVEDATRFAALETGEVHIAPIPTQNLSDAESNPQLRVIQQLDNGIRYLGFNTQMPPFDDVLVRQAISYAIDRDVIIRDAWDGYAEPVYGPLALTIGCQHPNIKELSYHYDPDKARELLKQAGWEDSNGDGIIDKAGEPFDVHLMVSTDDFFKRAAEIVEDQLRDVGIKVNIDIMDQPSLVAATTEGQHDMFLLLYGYTDPDILYYFFYSERTGGSNRAWYVNPRMDELVLAGRQELDPGKRCTIYEEAQEILVRDAPWVFLGNPLVFTAVRSEVNDFSIHPQGNYLLLDAYLVQK